MFCSFSLPLLIRLAFLQSTTGAFLSLRSSDAEKKRRPRLGIFCLIRQKPPCQLRVATAPILRSFQQLFWTEGFMIACNPSGMGDVTSSGWRPALAGVQLYREVFEVREFIVNNASRYDPLALRRSRITRSDRALLICILYFWLCTLIRNSKQQPKVCLLPTATAHWGQLLDTILSR